MVKRLFLYIKKWVEKKASLINHSEVLKDIYNETEISAGYYVILTFANLIALSGLIINSTPVIIGAMLISPLMGPILSFGFAFITGDAFVWKKSIRKITTSVALTIVVAAIATYISPLKEITNEILARTRPNLYDLIIAFLSGIAGAVALCTKKNYLTIVPGVAIATAVIPPLSVAGFSIGIWNWKIFSGSFFLFFTNFVAIVLSTCLVFYLYGFKPSIITETDISKLKKRVSVLAVILFLISIPLIYTLHQSISEVRLRNNIQSALKQIFDHERQSRLSTFSYLKKKDAGVEISAVINTVSYLKEPEITDAEKKIKGILNSDVKLYVEQVKVQPGGLREEIAKTLVPAITPTRPLLEIIRSSRENVLSVVKQSTEKIDRMISPSRIADFQVGFYDKSFKVSLAMKIVRDSPISNEEMLWIKNIIATDLNLPVDLSIETVPFVPLIVFKKGETSLSEEMKINIMPVKYIFEKQRDLKIVLEAYTGTYDDRKKLKSLSDMRIQAIKALLVKECNIPESGIKTLTHRSSKIEAPAVKITIMQNRQA